MAAEPVAKQPKTESGSIGTHSGTFQADEALGVWMLRQLPAYRHAGLVRSRDPAVLGPLQIVIDVGGTYDHSGLRYDHHQRGFFETFDGAVGPSGGADADRVATGPEEATGQFKTKLSASGLVYKHYGRELIAALHPGLSEDKLGWVWREFYAGFMEEIDANDNGIEIADSVRYKMGTTLPVRVHRLNAAWNAPSGPDQPSEDQRFEQASALCGAEFAAALGHLVEVELPAREVVEQALLGRMAVHGSGEVIRFSAGGCPWKRHLYELERTHSVDPLVKFVLYEDSSKMWRVQAVTVEGTGFTNRLSIGPEGWRGLRDEALCEASGIAGCKFVHNTGFIGGNETFEGALQMAVASLALA